MDLKSKLQLELGHVYHYFVIVTPGERPCVKNLRGLLQEGVLRGISIQLGVMDGGKASQGANIFTDIAFEMGQGLLQLHDRHFYVSSAAGSVCQVLRPMKPCS